jgi:ABC-type transport system substrate-binding protein
MPSTTATSRSIEMICVALFLQFFVVPPAPAEALLDNEVFLNAVVGALFAPEPGWAQKHGGVLKLYTLDSQAPEAICELAPNNVSGNLIVNRDAPPFQKPELRRAMALSLDRKAFIDILSDGQGNIGGVMQPPPEGIWGMPPDVLQTLPGYGPDVQKNRAEARQIMQTLGYGPENRLKIKVSTRNTPFYRDPDRPTEGGLHRRRA